MTSSTLWQINGNLWEAALPQSGGKRRLITTDIQERYVAWEREQLFHKRRTWVQDDSLLRLIWGWVSCSTVSPVCLLTETRPSLGFSSRVFTRLYPDKWFGWTSFIKQDPNLSGRGLDICVGHWEFIKCAFFFLTKIYKNIFLLNWLKYKNAKWLPASGEND